jgi:hypothetical protein
LYAGAFLGEIIKFNVGEPCKIDVTSVTSVDNATESLTVFLHALMLLISPVFPPSCYAHITVTPHARKIAVFRSGICTRMNGLIYMGGYVDLRILIWPPTQQSMNK